MGDVAVVGKSGRIQYVSEEDLDKYGMPAGYSKADPAYLRQEKEKESVTIGDLGAAVVTGGLKEVTAGTSDALIADIGGPEAKNYLRFLDQRVGAGRVAGQVIGGIGLTAGVGALARGAQAGSMLARTASGLRSAGGWGVAGVAGAEGAWSGLGDAVSESALYDKELTAEAIAARMGQGFKYGAVAGGAFALGGKMLGKAGQATESLISRSLRTADGDPGALSRILASMSGGDPKAFAKFADPEYLRGAKAAPDEIIRIRNRLADTDIRVAEEAGDIAHRYGTGGLKHDAVNRALREDGVVDDVTRRWASDTVDDIERVVYGEGPHPMGLMSDPAVAKRGLAAVHQDIIATKEAVLAAKSSGDVFMAMDRLKRSVGNFTYGKLGRDVVRPAEKATYDALDDLYENTLRKGLENKSMWGRAAEMQADINPAWKAHIEATSRTGMDRRLNKRSRSGDKGSWARHYLRDDVYKSLHNLEGGAKDQFVQDLAEHLDTKLALVERMAKHRGFLPDDDAIVKAAPEHVRAARTGIDEIREAERMARELKEMRQLSRDGDLLTAMAGHAIAGWPGAAILGSARNPYGVITKLSAVQSMAGGMEAAIESTVGRLAATASATAAAKTVKATKEYMDAREGLERYSSNRDQVKAELEESMAGISDHAPETSKAVVDTTMSRMDYLLKNMPPTLSINGRELPPSREELRTFQLRARALEDPTVLVKDLLSGKLDEATIDAVKTVYPALFLHMQTRVAEEWGTMQQDGRRFPFTQRILVGRLLDLPTDPTMDPHLLNILNQGYAANPTPDAPPPRRPKHESPAQAYRTSSDRLIGEPE